MTKAAFNREATNGFLFESEIPPDTEHQICQVLCHELILMHHEMMGGITSEGHIIFKNENFQRAFCSDTNPASDNFFSLVFPDDLFLVRHQLATIGTDDEPVSFTCRMVSGDDTVKMVSWRIKANSRCRELLSCHYLLIGHELSSAPPLALLTEQYRSSINDLVMARNTKFREIQQTVFNEIAKRRSIESRMTALITEVESEVIRLKEIVKNTQELLFVFDFDGNLHYINGLGAEFLGSPIHALIGKNKDEIGLDPEILQLLSEKPEYSATTNSPRTGVIGSGTSLYDYYLISLHDMNGTPDSNLLILQKRVQDMRTKAQERGFSPINAYLFFGGLTTALAQLFSSLRDKNHTSTA